MGTAGTLLYGDPRSVQITSLVGEKNGEHTLCPGSTITRGTFDVAIKLVYARPVVEIAYLY
jgi:hypothetical protein